MAMKGRVFELSFTDDDVVPARCRAALLLSPLGAIEVAIMELPENTGRSVTNSWPGVALRLLAAVLPTVPAEHVVFYEVYPDRFRGDENVSRVTISSGSHRWEYEQDPVVRKRIWSALGLDLEELERSVPNFGSR